MAVKKQVVVFSIVYNDNDTNYESAAEVISDSLFNEDGMLEWDFHVKSEEVLSADLTKEDLED